jgi:hypothetical protein
MNRLQTVARIWQGAVHDRGQGIGQIPLSDRAGQRFGNGQPIGLVVIGFIGHGCCVVRLRGGVKGLCATLQQHPVDARKS